IHIGTIILVCSPEPGTLSILQRPHSDAPASRTLPTTACQSHGSIDWPCQIYNISHFILSTLLYKNSEGHIHCQRVNFCMSSGECVHTVPTSLSLSSVPREERKEVGRGERGERERRGQGELDLDNRVQPPNCLFGPTCALPPAYRPPCHFPAFLYEIFNF